MPADTLSRFIYEGGGAVQDIVKQADEKFCPDCGSVIKTKAEICPSCGVRQAPPAFGKNRVTAALLAFFFGGFGVHKFYLGRTTPGILYLLFFWTLIPAFLAWIDFIVLLCSDDNSFNRKYSTANQ